MRSKPVYTLVVLSVLVLLVSTTATSSLAADYKYIGVKNGDNADYSLKQTGFASTTTWHMAISGVTGTDITVTATGTWPNGTAASDTMTGNVSLGETFPFVVAGNLGVHDPTYPGSEFEVNETITMSIAGASRTVNHVDYNVIIASTLYMSMQIWWDKPSGLMLQMKMYIYLAGWTNITATSVSLGGGGGGGGAGIDMTTLAIVGVVVVIVVVAIVAVVLMKRKK